MAISKYQAYFVIEDAKKEKSISRYHLPVDTALNAALQALQDIGGAINALIKGSIVTQGLNLVTDDDLAGGGADADSDVQEKGTFIFRDSAGFPVEITLPTFDEANLVAGTSTIDETDTQVSDFLTGVISGVNNTEPTPDTPGIVSSHADDITEFVEGYENWGKRRK